MNAVTDLPLVLTMNEVADLLRIEGTKTRRRAVQELVAKGHLRPLNPDVARVWDMTFWRDQVIGHLMSAALGAPDDVTTELEVRVR